MSERVKPALSREEWTSDPFGYHEVPIGRPGSGETSGRGNHAMTETAVMARHEGQAHALAALCLRGQDFGFSHADVDDERGELQILADHRDLYALGVLVLGEGQKIATLDRLIEAKRVRIAKLEALLPPDTTEPSA